jgi:hypothetical protein
MSIVPGPQALVPLSVIHAIHLQPTKLSYNHCTTTKEGDMGDFISHDKSQDRTIQPRISILVPHSNQMYSVHDAIVY